MENVAENLQTAQSTTDPFDQYVTGEVQPDITLTGKKQPTKEDPFDKYVVADQSPSAPETFAKTAAGAAVETGGVTAGMVGGAVAGGMVAGPPGALAGTIVGGVAGYFVGDEARSFLAENGYVTDNIEDLPDDQKSAAYAGEIFGSSLTMSGGFVAAGKIGIKAGTSLVGKWISGILNSASTSTKAFMAGEAGMATGAAVGSAIATEVNPDSTALRVGAEIVGGVLNPIRYITAGLRNVTTQAKNLAVLSSPAARESVAGKVLRETLEQYGEDPILVARILKQNGMTGIATTSAQKTGSPALGALEESLSKYSANFGAHSEKTARDGLEGIGIMIKAISQSGEPSALKTAAKLRSSYFKALLNGNIKAAEHKALVAASKITTDSQSARSELSRIATQSVDESLSTARLAESELWDKVPKGIAAIPDNTFARFASLKDELLAREKVPDVIEGTIKDWKALIKKGETLPTDELIKFRKRALVLARQADNTGNASDARFYGQLAESALDDVDTAFSKLGQSGDEALADAYNEARTFSRELHDTFTRSFVGKALAKGKYGQRIPPELVLKRALATGKEAGSLQMAELEEGTRFLINRGITDDSSLTVMLDAQERLIRLTASNTIDPETGKIATGQLSKFIRDNEELMNRFPEVKKDLTTALTSEQARKKIEVLTKKAGDVINKKTAFAKIVQGDPIKAAGDAIDALDPEKSITALAKLANRGGPEAIDGLRTSMLDASLKKATTPTGAIQLDKMKTLLFDSTAYGQKSVIDVMVKNGVISKEQVSTMTKLFDAAGKIKTARAPGIAIDVEEDAAGIITDLIVGGTGASIATKAAEAVGSRRILMIQAAGARAARKMFQKMPAQKIKDVLVEAMNDPIFAAKLLESTPTELATVEKVKYIHSYLIQSGFYGINDSVSNEE
jgi:predicted regulator of Ras-like GTPase activity (Roadblock/LC7/MglB family)